CQSLIANTKSVAGIEKLDTNANLNDGYFDIIILRKTNLAEFIRIATMALRGNHLDDDNIIYTKEKNIKVTPEKKMQLNIDGEYGGLLPGEFINLQRHIEFFVPQLFMEDY